MELLQVLKQKEDDMTNMTHDTTSSDNYSGTTDTSRLVPSLKFEEGLLKSALTKYFGHETFRPLQRKRLK